MFWKLGREDVFRVRARFIVLGRIEDCLGGLFMWRLGLNLVVIEGCGLVVGGREEVEM